MTLRESVVNGKLWCGEHKEKKERKIVVYCILLTSFKFQHEKVSIKSHISTPQCSMCEKITICKKKESKLFLIFTYKLNKKKLSLSTVA